MNTSIKIEIKVGDKESSIVTYGLTTELLEIAIQYLKDQPFTNPRYFPGTRNSGGGGNSSDHIIINPEGLE